MKWLAQLMTSSAPVRAPRLGAAYEQHNVPPRAVAGTAVVLRVLVRNTGERDWLRDPPDGAHAGLALYVDGTLVSVGKPCTPVVRPGESALIAVSAAWPTAAGPHRLRFDMMISGEAFFSQRGVPPLEVGVDLAPAEDTATDRLLAVSRRRNPWFFSPGSGIHRSRDGRPAYPVFAESARGCTVTDVDGREYVDLLMGWGSCLLGYGEERVKDALARSVAGAAMASVPHRLEMEVSEALCGWFGFGDDVVFGKNGSDVTTWAARSARLATGRKTIVYAGFHGWQDWNGAALGFAASGIPGGDARHAVRIHYRDQHALEAAVAAHAHDLAAVMIEPAATASHVEDPLHEQDGPFLLRAQELAWRHGALFVLDEIFTGFRFRTGSAQRSYGLTPDLTCLGKALGNGMPLSALVGRGGALRAQVDRILYMATYRGEVHSFAAALAALETYRDEDVPQDVWAAGEAIRAGVDEACRRLGLVAGLVGPPYRMYFAFFEGDAAQRVWWRTLLQQELARNGVISHKGYVITSRGTDGGAVTRAVEAFGAALAVVAACVDARTALAHLDIPDVFEEARS